MSKWIAMLVSVLVSVGAYAAPETGIWDYFTAADYKYVSSTVTNAGDTGLATGTVYVCFALTGLSDITANQAGANATGDVRVVERAIAKKFYDLYMAQTATNRPANCVLQYNVTYTGDTNAPLTETITLRTKMSIGSIAVPAE